MATNQPKFREACLTCPVFVTTEEFLPEHHRQLDATRALISQAEHRGQDRVVEMNRTVERNLLAIITGLSTQTPCCQGSSARCACADGTSTKEVPDAG